MVDTEQTTTEEVKTTVENQSSDDATQSETKVEVEKTVEQTEETKSDETESNVNVSIDQKIETNTSDAPTHDPNKNTEAAQPVVDPIV